MSAPLLLPSSAQAVAPSMLLASPSVSIASSRSHLRVHACTRVISLGPPPALSRACLSLTWLVGVGQSMIFPTVTSSAANGLGGADGEGDAERLPGSGGKEKKKRREGREGKERRDGRRAREAAEAAGCADREVSLSVSGDGLSSQEWTAPDSPSLTDTSVITDPSVNPWGSTVAGGGAGDFDPSLMALAGELPWGHNALQAADAAERSNGERWNGGLDARAPTVLAVDGGVDLAISHTGVRYGSSVLDAGDASGVGGGSQALYEMFKAATDQAATQAAPSPPAAASTLMTGWTYATQPGDWAMTSPTHGYDPERPSCETQEAGASPVAKSKGQGAESVAVGVLVAPASGGPGEENVDEEAWAAGIHRWVGGEKDVSPREDLQ